VPAPSATRDHSGRSIRIAERPNSSVGRYLHAHGFRASTFLPSLRFSKHRVRWALNAGVSRGPFERDTHARS
jgi:hypothetical protein